MCIRDRTVTVRAADEGWNDVDYMIGALYQLVENGVVCKGLEAGAAPRTAIGQKADGSLVPVSYTHLDVYKRQSRSTTFG